MSLIPDDYEIRIRNGEPLDIVLGSRKTGNREKVLDAVVVWLKTITRIQTPGMVEIALFRMLPELEHDHEVMLAIQAEIERREAEKYGHFGQELQDKKGRYQLLERLGGGAQGTVWRAVDRQFKGSSRSTVAIKIYEGPVTDEGIRARSVDHRSVVSVYDLGEVDGKAYIVYQLLDGVRLDQWMGASTSDMQRPSKRQLIQIMIELCEGIEAIHASSIVHRDIKPGNIMIVGNRPIITDFGVAVTGLEDQEPAGTSGCMAPEQALGTGDTTSVDVYAAGAVLVWMFTGSYTQTDSIDDLRVRAIAEKCLSRYSSDRYLSAGAIARDLRNYQSNRSLEDIEEPFSRRVLLGAKRRPVVAAFAIAVLSIGLIQLIQKQTVINQQRLDHEELLQELNESMTQLNETMIEAENLSATKDRLLRSINNSVLSMRLRDTRIDPAHYWAIADLGKDSEWNDWVYATLVSAEGAEMLRHEVLRQSKLSINSRVTVGYWWWILARIESRVEHIPAEQVAQAYSNARDAFVEVLGENEPLVFTLNEEIQRVVE